MKLHCKLNRAAGTFMLGVTLDGGRQHYGAQAALIIEPASTMPLLAIVAVDGEPRRSRTLYRYLRSWRVS